MTKSLMDIKNFAPFVEGLDHPEGVTWGQDGNIYAGGEAGQIYRISLDGKKVEQIGTTGGFILGLCPDGAGNIFACDMGNHAIKRITPAGNVTTYSDGNAERKMVTPNYAVFDRHGNLYVSDSGIWRGNDGCMWLVRPGGATELLKGDFPAFPNGLALSPDGSFLYIVLSNVPGVARVALGKDGQAAGQPEMVVELPRQVPDGLAFDVEGNLYIGCYTPDIIYRLSPDRQLEMLAEDWEGATFATPTNLAFCGADRRTLVVASLSRWHLTKGPMPLAGAPLHYPNL